MTHDTSGPPSPQPFARYDPASSCWRTCPGTAPEASEPFSRTWPRQGMTRRGQAFELAMSAHRTDANGSSSLLPTPEAKLCISGPDYARASRPGSGGDDLTTTMAKLLPTPRAGEAEHGSPNQHGSRGNHDRMLTGVVMQDLLPTPDAYESKRGGSDCAKLDRPGHGGPYLAATVMNLLPTPEASDATGGRVSKQLGGTRPSGSKRAITLSTALSHGVSTNPPFEDGKPPSGG